MSKKLTGPVVADQHMNIIPKFDMKDQASMLKKNQYQKHSSASKRRRHTVCSIPNESLPPQIKSKESAVSHNCKSSADGSSKSLRSKFKTWFKEL